MIRHEHTEYTQKPVIAMKDICNVTRCPFASQSSTSPIAVVHTISSVMLLCVYSIIAPYTNCTIITRRCQHMRICWVPANTVHRPWMSSQCRNKFTWASVPYINLKYCNRPWSESLKVIRLYGIDYLPHTLLCGITLDMLLY